MSKSEKQKISEMIQQRIKQKKQRQLANRPRVPVLKVMFTNCATTHHDLSERKTLLQAQLSKQCSLLSTKTEALTSTANMLRQPHTQIKIQTDFYASESIPIMIKDFYRKSSNNFMKMAIVQKRNLGAFRDKQNMVEECLKRIKDLEDKLRANEKKHRKMKEDQLVANMNQKLRYEDAVQRGVDLRTMTADLHQKYADMEKEYVFKKTNLDNMEQRVKNLRNGIQSQIKKYQATFNVLTYREHLHKVFTVKLKIECLQDKVRQSYADITNAKNTTTQLQQSLERKNSFTRLGKLESFRTESKRKRGNSVATTSCLSERKMSFGKMSFSGLNSTGLMTDRTPSTGRKTMRNVFQ